MSQDLRLQRGDDGAYDLVVESSKFTETSGFETAIIVSLLTDARAPASSVPTPSRRRGWVGNIETADTGRQLGSRLWTFEQSRLTDAILNDLSVAAAESLTWMTEDGIASSVTATALKDNDRQVSIEVTIETLSGREERYSLLWRQTNEL